MIELLIVDDHTIFRAGMRRLMSDEADMQVVDEAPDGATALAKIRSRHYDVVVLDISMPGRNGLDTLAAIRAEKLHLPVLMLSMHNDEQYTLLALRARANAYLSKDVDADELKRAIRHVSNGGSYVPANLAASLLIHQHLPSERPPHEMLSPREMQIMMDIVKGKSLTDIGAQMYLSVKTVSTYRSRILQKMAVTTNAELVKYAMRTRLID
jgi:two-component system, NarL family, invasion response regulator UvrY